MADYSARPGRFLLLYGSQTGQSQAIAEEIFDRSHKHGLVPDLHCMSMMDKKFQVDKERCVVIVTSTTGDGDPPDTAIKFVRRFNRKILPPDFLANVKYSVLGLGDSNYSSFCNNAKNIDRRFSELGAQHFHPSAFADEVDGLDVAADPWIYSLFPALQKLVGCCSDSHAPRPSMLDDAPSNKIGGDSCNSNASEGGSSNDRPSVSVILSKISSVTEETEKDTVDSGKRVSGDSESFRTESLTKTDGKRTKSDVEQTKTDSINISDSNVSQTELQTLENGVAETEIANKNNNSDSGVTPQEEVADFLEVKAPATSDAPSLGVSDSDLSEKTLTLPAATPTFLTLTYLSADEDLESKMAELPWQNGCKPPSAASDIMKAKVVLAERMTAEDAVKKTLLLRLNLKGDHHSYYPGDSISIICPNNHKEVSQLLKRLGLLSKADLPMKLGILPDTKKRRAAVPPHVPEEGASLRYVLRNCLDIRDPPKKALLRQLVNYTSDAAEKRRLQELCSKEGATHYTAHVHNEHVSLLDVLYTFPSCRPPVERLLEHLPRLQPRPYSVCSCEQWRPNHLDIAFNVVDIPPSTSRLYARRGLCTGWLDDVTTPLQRPSGVGGKDATNSHSQSLHVAEADNDDGSSGIVADVESLSLHDVEIRMFFRTRHHFRSPQDLSLPLVMVGPGTGVAPYIGFLQERQLRLSEIDNKEKDHEKNAVGETWLLFGCRHKDRDFLFRSAIEQFQRDKTLTRFLPAFSRDPPREEDRADAPKYVQDNILAHAEELCGLLHDKDGVVCVCGDAKHMAADVAAAFQEIFVRELGMSDEQAKDFLMSLKIHHRYLEDVWT